MISPGPCHPGNRVRSTAGWWRHICVFLAPGSPTVWWPWYQRRFLEVLAQSATGPEVCVIQVIQNKRVIWGRLSNAFFFFFDISTRSLVGRKLLPLLPHSPGPSALLIPGPFHPSPPPRPGGQKKLAGTSLVCRTSRPWQCNCAAACGLTGTL